MKSGEISNMATGNIDCPINTKANCQRNSNFPGNLNYQYAAISDMEEGTPYINFPSTALPDLYPEDETLQLNNQTSQPMTAFNDNNQSSEVSVKWSSHAHQELLKSLGINDNDIFLQWGNRNLCDQQLIRSVIPEEQLSINVEEDGDSAHSWRPCATNSLSSDFFLPHPPIELSIPLEEDGNMVAEAPQLFIGHSDKDMSGSPEKKTDVRSSPHSKHISGVEPRHDIQSYLQSQKSELNILKYEVMNARRKIIEGKEVVENLTYHLKERELFQNSQEIEKLKKENAQLRLECQCLCMEVDHYLKGQGKLCEIDENFYKESATAQNNKSVAPTTPPSQPVSTPHLNETGNPDSLEEGDRWECHICTFANHPAINCCEMCQSQRLRKRHLPTATSSNDTCFCHPKDQSESR